MISPMSHLKQYGLTSALCILLQLYIIAQPSDLKFENFDSRKGLENNSINNLVRDSSGYIGISGNGITRYDGINTIKYFKDNKPNSLREDSTDNLIVDKNGTVWIGAGVIYAIRIKMMFWLILLLRLTYYALVYSDYTYFFLHSSSLSTVRK